MNKSSIILLYVAVFLIIPFATSFFINDGIVVLSFFLLCISFYLMHKTVRIFDYFTIPGFFFIFFLVFIYAGSFYVYSTNQDWASTKYFLAVNSVLLLIPVGITIANIFFRFKPKTELDSYFQMPLQDNLKDSVFIIPYILIIFFTIGLFAHYLSHLETIPFLALISMDSSGLTSSELAGLRYAATGGFIGTGYLYAIPIYILFPLLSYIALAKYFVSKKRFWLANFIILFFINIFASLATNQKAPIAMYLISLFILFSINQGKINYKKSLLLIGLLFLVILPIVYLQNPEIPSGEERILRSFQGISNRLFIDQTEILYNYFKIFPDIHPFVYGRTIGKLSDVMGWEHFPSSSYVYDALFPESAGQGGANTAFIGDMYVDFGYEVMLISIVFVGFLLQTFQIWLMRAKKTAINIALLSFLCISFSKLSQTSLFVTLSTFGVIWSIAAVFLLKSLYTVLIGALRKSKESYAY